MNIFPNCSSDLLTKAITNVLGITVGGGVVIVQDRQIADLVIVDSKPDMMSDYDSTKHFAIISMLEANGLPDNARWISPVSALADLALYVQEIRLKTKSNSVLEHQIGIPIFNGEESGSEIPRLLIIDDSPENLSCAVDQLADKHTVTLADGYDRGMGLLIGHESQYDAVLTDCQMPAGLYHASMTPDAIDMNTPVHNGMLVMFFATAAGLPCSLVTDANQHKDWVSAAIDNLGRQKHTINGQPVVFYNSGKDWLKAYELLRDCMDKI